MPTIAPLADRAEVQQHWDHRFLAADLHPWGRAPNPTVVDLVADLAPGDALDLGAGDGRNARWLAEHGWRVTAVDISEVALGELLADAWGHGWDLTTVHADLRTWVPPEERFDLVVLSFLHIPQPYRSRLHRAAMEALRPGGHLVLVAHDRSNLADGTGGPQDVRMLPTLAEVRRELGGVAIERAEIVSRPVDGAPRPARDLVVRARRRAATS